MNIAKRVNPVSIFTGLTMWLVSGGTTELEKRLSRQVIQWIGAAWGSVSLLGYWGIIDGFTLNNDQFWAGVVVAGGMMGFNLADTLLAMGIRKVTKITQGAVG